VATHALADAYTYLDAEGTEYSLTINHVLFGASLRQSFGNDNQGLFARADLGFVSTSANLTVNDTEIEVPGESGFGFLARAGYGITASGDFNIAPQVTFAGYSLARRSGVPKTTLHGWSNGRAVQNLEQLRKVACALEVTVYYLAFGREDPFGRKPPQPGTRVNLGVLPPEILRQVFDGHVRVITESRS
jgi:hypothetical protein